mmetsp:Transcript_17429/g.56040  ORF Transcript_17429/g.56040 Transcript_17429/m.56040 type:complete len:90 (-) Transcript_17429:1160-1429(-)
MTLVSTATKALFLQPTDALHGDLGICSPEDLLLMFDREGEDDQMLGMIPYVKAKVRRENPVVANPVVCTQALGPAFWGHYHSLRNQAVS